jgi:hypothetical protein
VRHGYCLALSNWLGFYSAIVSGVVVVKWADAETRRPPFL